MMNRNYMSAEQNAEIDSYIAALKELTAEQVATIVSNYILLTTNYMTHKVTKSEIYDTGVMQVSLRVSNSLGKKKTLTIFIGVTKHGYTDVEAGRMYVTGEYCYKDALNLLEMEIAQPLFGTVEEEKRKIEQAKQDEAAAKAKDIFDRDVKRINEQCAKYNSYQMQSYKRELKRFGTTKLVDFLPALNDVAAEVVRTVLVELGAKQERETILRNPRLVQYTPNLESILNQIEESVKSLELEVYANVLAWLKVNESNALRSYEAQAADYIEQQKAKMLYATIRDLQGLDIDEVQSFGVRNHHNGFEGTWILLLADGTIKTYQTHTIIAGGCIQRDHYRYLTNLK